MNIREYDPNSEEGKRIKEFTEFLDKAWYGNPSKQDSFPTATVDVWMGYMGKEDDRWWAVSYSIDKIMTGRAGFLLYYKQMNKALPGFPIQYSIFKRPVSREEFIKTMKLGDEIAAIDRELNLVWE